MQAQRQCVSKVLVVVFCLIGLVGLKPDIAQAQPEPEAETTELQSADILSSAQLHYPKIIEGLADRRAAEARALAAEGAFDLIFDVQGYGWATGFYDGRSVEGTMSRRLQDYGAEVYSGYQVSNGDFPIYEDKRFTNTGGQFELGVLFSLIRDRDIDEERFLLTDTDLATRAADFDVLLTRIGVAQQALIAYWRWVALGHKQRVFEELLSIAMLRQRGLEQEVKRGAQPQIVPTENQQNITRRKSLLSAAQRDFHLAANELSLFYRDDEGDTVIASDERLPSFQPAAQNLNLIPAMQNVDQTIQQRPEVLSIRNTITRTLRKIELNQNEL